MLPLHGTLSDQTRTARSDCRPRSSNHKFGRSIEPWLVTALADPAQVVFLDLETTGLSWFYDEVTVVGWMQDGKYQLHIAGDDPAPLLKALRAAEALVTFNGTLFDLRFLRKTFGELTLPRAHIDLRYLSRRVGLTGGQKAVERVLNLPQRVGFEDVDGAAAVVLWHKYLRGDNRALARLVEYNRHDVVGMCGILDAVLDRLSVQPDLWFSRPQFEKRARLALSRRAPKLARDNTPAALRRGATFESLFAGTQAERATVIGIDLTGSEMRPSGWCTLRGNEATTCTVSSDDELLGRVVAERPALVSIDSPLSLPFGRTKVEDDDPGRDQFGIMRSCERELKRRGINVYPCLLPSMQRLTARGMRLAKELRSVGIPVIESYPGAAQDIMGIPRKGAGQEFLRQGLSDFGIWGPFTREAATHDELDAITSAVVGSFFLAGKHEALCGPSEDALIIPNLKANGRAKMVVGISGKICAGKTTTARFLEELGFTYTRFSLAVDNEIIARGGTLNRATRQAVGLEINRSKGQRWLCERVLERVAGSDLVVVDGLRFPEDHAFFFERFGSEFVHVHVQAADELRAQRYREQEQNGSSFEAAESQPVERNSGELAAFASCVHTNDGSLAEHRESVLNCLRLLSQGQDHQCLSRLL